MRRSSVNCAPSLLGGHLRGPVRRVRRDPATELPRLAVLEVKHLMLGVLSSYQWTTAARHSELGVLSSYQRMAAARHLELGSSYQWTTAARHSELGVLSSYQRMVVARHLELGVLSSFQEMAIVRHPELICIVLNRYKRDLSEPPNDPVNSSSKR